jgi:hypothetical protein
METIKQFTKPPDVGDAVICGPLPPVPLAGRGELSLPSNCATMLPEAFLSNEG